LSDCCAEPIQEKHEIDIQLSIRINGKLTMKNSYLLITLLWLLATPVYAHHPLAGLPMETFLQGLLAGVGHPILGFNHLFFVLGVGLAAAFTGRALVVPLFYIGGMLGGFVLIMMGIQLPLIELSVALSLVVLGTIVLAGQALTFNVAAILHASLGVFHGWAFGETIVGQESASIAVLGGYLIGLGGTQWPIAIATAYYVSTIWKATLSSAIQPRLAGAVVVGVGVTFTLEWVEVCCLLLRAWVSNQSLVLGIDKVRRC
jgi:urease accessory protein